MRERDELWEELESLRKHDESANKESIILIRELKEKINLLAGENERLLGALEEKETQLVEMSALRDASITLAKEHAFVKNRNEVLQRELEEFRRRVEPAEKDRDHFATCITNLKQQVWDLLPEMSEYSSFHSSQRFENRPNAGAEVAQICHELKSRVQSLAKETQRARDQHATAKREIENAEEELGKSK